MESLNNYLEILKLPRIYANYAQAAEACLKTGASYEGFLNILAEQEVLGRMDANVQLRLKKAQFPSLKTLENFNFKFIPSLNEKLVLSLSNGQYLENATNILLLGPSGTGKSHIATALGVAACQMRQAVLFKSAAQLVHELIKAYDDGQLLKMQKKLKTYKLLIIDELGYVPFSKTGAELLFEVLSQSYERQSLIITSNLPFEEWPQVFGCPRLTGALLDRLTHHVEILQMNGASYRLNNGKR